MSTATAASPYPPPGARRAARQRRVRAIRRWILAGAVTLFVAVWLLITVVLVSGHDPALSKSMGAAVSTPSVSSSSGSQGSSSASDGSSTSSASQGSSGPITTRSS